MTLKERIFKEKLYGVFMKIIDNPAINILAKEAKLDFMFYDCEHGMYTYEKLHSLILMGNSVGVPAFVRVPQLSKGDISKSLDCGATGVMVPMIEDRKQAELLVQWSKYPPVGKRGYSGGANTDYKPSGNHKNNMAELNKSVISIAQIETELGVQNIEEILTVEGVDAVIVGPADLAISLGIPGDYFNEIEIQAIDKVACACEKYKKGFGIIGKLELIERYKNQINFLISKIDVDIIREGFAKSVEDFDNLYI
ncbi:HpcH/HpaI aldolase family protein [Clostridium fungisolvens]|uniref:2-keto-3-deoxy-L-rhamnonate aldolase n=1 Tax=Clostridium fungisolvens TaxID=1604897 RepID=A0A6V8SG08_9CLOT|nr:aldolase/citrate lyase family protein [Clostridium fungisolvens]GFP75636.1 2-keto-3-deoxy-L-rhamnonate aldolase [Clostridium fungisolvens]